MYGRILVPTDGSAADQKAIDIHGLIYATIHVRPVVDTNDYAFVPNAVVA